MANFDVKRVTPLEWAGIGAGALAFIVSFFPWYSISFDGGGLAGFDLDTSLSAWNAGFGAWFSVLLLVAAAVVVLLPHFGTQVPNQPLVWLGLSAAALVIIILRWVTFPSASGFGGSAGAGFGLFIGLAAALVSGVAAFLVYRSTSNRATAA
jgi:hypothetical protein